MVVCHSLEVITMLNKKINWSHLLLFALPQFAGLLTLVLIILGDVQPLGELAFFGWLGVGMVWIGAQIRANVLKAILNR